MLLQITLDTANTADEPLLEAVRRALYNRALPLAPDPEPTDEPDDPDEQVLDSQLVDEAVAKATAIIRTGQDGKTTVQNALAKVGVKRVTQLETNAQVREFIAALEESD